jgi:hypothetical protein
MTRPQPAHLTAERAGLAWSALVLVALVLWLLPMSVRGA